MKRSTRTHGSRTTAARSSCTAASASALRRWMPLAFAAAVVAVLSGILCPISGVVDIPSAFAEGVGVSPNVDNNPEGKELQELKADQCMSTNQGTIVLNSGTLYANQGTVKKNAKDAYIFDNHGTINVSNGIVYHNYGTIDTYFGRDSDSSRRMTANYGNIKEMAGNLAFNEGTIKELANGWKVEVNDKSGTIIKVASGGIVVDNVGVVENLELGDIENNYGTVNKRGQHGIIHHQFYAVDLSAVYTETVPGGIIIDGLDDHAIDQRYGKYVPEGGSLIITAAEGWYIAGWSGVDDQATPVLSDGGAKLMLNNVSGDLVGTIRLGKLYDLYIGGTRVTTSNCNDVFGDGTASFNPLTNTLFLTNASIDAQGTGHAGIEAGFDINLIVDGNCTVQGDTDHGGIVAKGDLHIKESDDDFSLKILGRKASGTFQETVLVNGVLTVDDGSLEIENAVTASQVVQTAGEVVVKAEGGPLAGGVNATSVTLSGGTFTSYGPLGGTRCQLSITGATVVFDCKGAPRWVQNTATSVVVAPPDGKVTAVVYGTSEGDSAESEAASISGSPFSAATNITSYVNPGSIPSSARSSYFATKSGAEHTVAIYDGDELRSTVETVEGFPFGFTANASVGYIVDTVVAQTKSGRTVAVSGPDEDGGYEIDVPTDDVDIRFAYKPITYSIAYDGNRPVGASTTVTGETPAQEGKAYDTTFDLSENGFLLNGYAFTGWNTDPSGSGTSYADGASVQNLATEQDAQIVLYAQWEPYTYQVHFDGGDADGTMDPQTFTFDRSAPLDSIAFTYGSHTFQCWKRLAFGATKSYADGETVVNLNQSFDAGGKPQDATLVAYWMSSDAIAITVMKDQQALEGIAGRISLKEGDTVFEHDGMFAEQSAGVYVYQPTEEYALPDEGTFAICIDGEDTMQQIVLARDGESKTSATIAYYSVSASAQWADGGDDPCSISLLNGAALSGENCFVSGSVVSISVDASTIAPGYSFDRWVALGADPGGDAWNPEETSGSFTLSGTVDMLATQAANWYYVEFIANVPATCSTTLEGDMLDQKLWYDSETNLVPCDYILPCYLFVGWNTAEDGSGTTYADEASVKNFTTELDATVTLYAQWAPVTYLIEFVPNGGVGPTTYQTCTYDEAAELKVLHFMKPDYHFAAWNTASDGSGTSYGADDAVLNLADTQDAVITFYAQWERDEYTVVYDANEPAVITSPVEGSMEPSTFYVGEQAPLPLCALTLEGFVFKGWNTAPDGTGTSYENAEIAESIATIRNATVTLYAQWERDPAFYRFIEGMGGVWMRDSGSTLRFKANGAFELFTEIEVDGQPVERGNYSAWSGSTYIALQASFLQGLATGEHTITAVYEDGQCSTTFTVNEKGTPGTGDSTFKIVGAIAAVIAVALIALVIAYMKRRKK